MIVTEKMLVILSMVLAMVERKDEIVSVVIIGVFGGVLLSLEVEEAMKVVDSIEEMEEVIEMVDGTMVDGTMVNGTIVVGTHRQSKSLHLFVW